MKNYEKLAKEAIKLIHHEILCLNHHIGNPFSYGILVMFDDTVLRNHLAVINREDSPAPVTEEEVPIEFFLNCYYLSGTFPEVEYMKFMLFGDDDMDDSDLKYIMTEDGECDLVLMKMI